MGSSPGSTTARLVIDRMSAPAPPRPTATLCRILATVLCLGVHGCTEATGGAVELSWALRSTRDRDIPDCAEGRIGRIRLWWDSGTSTRYIAFPCQDNHGVTAFDLPTGEVALSVTPECADGISADPDTFVAPPPIVRVAAIGETITLDAVLLVLQVDDCTTRSCVCMQP